MADMQRAVDCVYSAVKVPLNQNQFDALCDFTYNVGCGAFEGSTLLLRLNAGDYTGSAAQFAFWDKAAGRVVQGLENRRAAEAALFQEAA